MHLYCWGGKGGVTHSPLQVLAPGRLSREAGRGGEAVAVVVVGQLRRHLRTVDRLGMCVIVHQSATARRRQCVVEGIDVARAAFWIASQQHASPDVVILVRVELARVSCHPD